MNAATGQWLRRASLTVSRRVSDVGDLGEADALLDLSEMRFRFEVRRQSIEVPGHADVRVYNLSDATAAALESAVTTLAPGAPRRVLTLQAGYEGSGAFGAIFQGELIQARRGRESPTDTYVDLLAVDGDFAYTGAVAKLNLDTPSPRDLIRAAADAMRPYGVRFREESIPPEIPDAKAPRGYSEQKKAADLLRELGQAHGFNWSIQSGELVIVMRGQALPGPAIPLNSATGLVGLPEQAHGALVARCLINPEIKPDRSVEINQASVQQSPLDPAWGAVNAFRPIIAQDGIYRVLAVDAVGDTRGHEWHQRLTMLAPGDFTPSTLGIITP